MSKGLWIPAEMLADRSLTPMEKLFLSEILHLHGVDGCHALNEHFAERFAVGKSRASQIITSLVAKKRVECSFQYDGKEIVGRTITPSGNLKTPLCRKPKETPLEESATTPLGKREDTKQYTKHSGRSSSSLTPPTVAEVREYAASRGLPDFDAQRFIDYYAAADWNDAKGKPVRNWKQKLISVWEPKAKGVTVDQSDPTHEATPEEIKALRAAGALP